MITEDPLLQGPISWKKLQVAVVTNDIWPEVLFLTLIATSKSPRLIKSHPRSFCSGFLCGVLTLANLSVSNQLLTTLGSVCLAVSFRTSSAYER